ncbi:Os04g0220650 [Oryza sativa Japonica Group]|uniref:Os04g0220650 protein n=1 Tax=Oryza sativa subsp. japonica TaxID=39947 RepID=A0A0P0W7K2_ORYSJ|nr:Os04g0220650 [Oryza sativa Japonica Group]
MAAFDLSELERVGAAESHRCIPHPAGHPSRLPRRSLWVGARGGASAGEDASVSAGSEDEEYGGGTKGAEDGEEGLGLGEAGLVEEGGGGGGGGDCRGSLENRRPLAARVWPGRRRGRRRRAGVRITLGAAEDEEEASEGKEGEEEVAYEGEEFAQAGGVTLDDGDVDVVGGEDVNEVRGVGDDNDGVTTVDGSKLQYSGGVDVDVDGSVHYPHAPLHAAATGPTTASRA